MPWFSFTVEDVVRGEHQHWVVILTPKTYSNESGRWGRGLGVEFSPNLCKALSLIPNIIKRKEEWRERKRQKSVCHVLVAVPNPRYLGLRQEA